MASPFYLFRKYQKAFIAVLAVGAMFIFVVADPLMTWLQQANGAGGGQSANAVVASWDGGSLTNQQLDNIARRRVQISQFLELLIRNAATKVEQEGGSPLPPTLPNFIIENNNFSAVQVNCVSTRVFAELAERSGISISNSFVNHYLKEWGLRRTTDVEMAEYLGRVGLAQKSLFDGLRELLMANFYINSYSLAIQGQLPEQRWEDWRRINERIAVEAAVVPTDKFLSQVPEPTDEQLQQFYELHKDREPGTIMLVNGTRLPSPDPGFREPRRVKLQYLVGSVDQWTQKYLDEVTEVEIADYYERNKRLQFVKADITSIDGLFDDPIEPEQPEESPDTTEEPESEPANEATAEEPMEEEAAESTETDEPEAETPAEQPAEPEQPAEESPASEEAAAEESVEAEQPEEPAEPEQPAEEQPAGEQPASEEPAADESGELVRNSPFRLAAFQTEASDEASTVEGQETTDEGSASDEGEPATVEDAASDEASDGDAEEEQVTYVPLSEVREQIRRALAQDKAVVELQKVVGQTLSSLQSAYNPYGLKVVQARSNEEEIPAPPTKLADYRAIAEQTGLVSEETVLLSRRELAETLVGKALDAQTGFEFGTIQAMFGDHDLYEPYQARELDGSNLYIVTKVEDVPSRVPEFKEARDDVLVAWKQAEAAKLALAAAEELVKHAQSEQEPLAEAAGEEGYSLETTDLFSWSTFGTTAADFQRGPRLGDAPPLTAIGPEFMEKAFGLKAGELAAVQNYDKTNAYVIQVARREQTESDLRQQFLAEANTWYGNSMMSYVRNLDSQRQLTEQLTENVGLNLDKLEEIINERNQRDK